MQFLAGQFSVAVNIDSADRDSQALCFFEFQATVFVQVKTAQNACGQPMATASFSPPMGIVSPPLFLDRWANLTPGSPGFSNQFL